MQVERKLILRTCASDMTSYHGTFLWPSEGKVEAPDWTPEPKCGGGLHGLLWGEGSGALLDWGQDAKWLVVEVDGDIVDLDGKVKFRSGNVLFCGSRLDATKYLIANGGSGCAIVGSTLTGGNGSTLTGGDGSTLTGGDDSTLTGGNGSTLTGGDGSTLTGGNGSTLTGGDGSTLTGGYGSTLTGGDGSTLTGGNGSTLTGGNGSTLTGGDSSTLIFKFWVKTKNRHCFTIAYVGENGIKSNTVYRLGINNQPIEVFASDGE